MSIIGGTLQHHLQEIGSRIAKNGHQYKRRNGYDFPAVTPP
jgi:hypothetical protein